MPIARRRRIKFTLRGPLDAEQRDFLDTYGYIHFRAFATPAEIEMIREELGRIEAAWIAERRQTVNGIPIRYGTRPDGSRYVNRFAFTSLFSRRLRDFLADERWEAVRARLRPPSSGSGSTRRTASWSTSSSTSRARATSGSAGTSMRCATSSTGACRSRCSTSASISTTRTATRARCASCPAATSRACWRMLFGKLHFLDHRDDPREVILEADAGDLTFHDGRTWHRVGKAQTTGLASLRRTMYLPFLTGPFEPKTETSPMPLYHRFSARARLAVRAILVVAAALLVAAAAGSARRQPAVAGALRRSARRRRLHRRLRALLEPGGAGARRAGTSASTPSSSRARRATTATPSPTACPTPRSRPTPASRTISTVGVVPSVMGRWGRARRRLRHRRRRRRVRRKRRQRQLGQEPARARRERPAPSTARSAGRRSARSSCSSISALGFGGAPSLERPVDRLRRPSSSSAASRRCARATSTRARISSTPRATRRRGAPTSRAAASASPPSSACAGTTPPAGRSAPPTSAARASTSSAICASPSATQAPSSRAARLALPIADLVRVSAALRADALADAASDVRVGAVVDAQGARVPRRQRRHARCSSCPRNFHDMLAGRLRADARIAARWRLMLGVGGERGPTPASTMEPGFGENSNLEVGAGALVALTPSRRSVGDLPLPVLPAVHRHQQRAAADYQRHLSRPARVLHRRRGGARMALTAEDAAGAARSWRVGGERLPRRRRRLRRLPRAPRRRRRRHQQDVQSTLQDVSGRFLLHALLAGGLDLGLRAELAMDLAGAADPAARTSVAGDGEPRQSTRRSSRPTATSPPTAPSCSTPSRWCWRPASTPGLNTPVQRQRRAARGDAEPDRVVRHRHRRRRRAARARSLRQHLRCPPRRRRHARARRRAAELLFGRQRRRRWRHRDATADVARSVFGVERARRPERQLDPRRQPRRQPADAAVGVLASSRRHRTAAGGSLDGALRRATDPRRVGGADHVLDGGDAPTGASSCGCRRWSSAPRRRACSSSGRPAAPTSSAAPAPAACTSRSISISTGTTFGAVRWTPGAALPTDAPDHCL